MPKKGEVDLPKLKYWRAVLADHERSGLSGQAYCNQKGIPYTAFANRRRRIASSTPAAEMAKRGVSVERNGSRSAGFEYGSEEQPAFAEVKVKAPQKEQGTEAGKLDIELPGGIVLRVPDGYSVAMLAAVVSTLENL
jgi:hypothetical protein